MDKFSFQMPDEMHQELKEAAQEQETSMAAVCREALTEHIEAIREEPSFEEFMAAAPEVYCEPPRTECEEVLSEPPPLIEKPKIRKRMVEELSDVVRSAAPWHVRYRNKISNFYNGPKPKEETQPTYRPSVHEHERYGDWFYD